MKLPDLIKTGKSNTIEFKEKFDEQTIESAVALANTKGGIIPELEKIKVDGKTVIAVKIKENPIKPISKKGRCLKRVDSSNRAMSAQEVAQMHLHSTEMSWDKYPARNAKLANIDLDDGVKVNYTKFEGLVVKI